MLIAISLWGVTYALIGVRESNGAVSQASVWFFTALIVIAAIAGITSVVALRRHPELILRPTNPLIASAERKLWIVVIATGTAAVVAAVVWLITDSTAIFVLELVVFTVNLVVCVILNRRADQVSTSAARI